MVNKKMENKKFGYDANGNPKIVGATVKARINMSSEGKLTLRLFLNKDMKDDFCLEKGTQPNTIFTIIIL